MDRIAFALQDYERIGKEEPFSIDGPGMSRSHWIDRSLCPIVAELLSQPDFQHLATWSRDQFCPGAKSPGRKLIIEIDEALRAIATDLHAISLQPTVKAKPMAKPSLKGWRATETAIVGAPESKQSPKFRNPLTADPEKLSKQLKAIAVKPWHDLANEFDFFSLSAGLNLKEPQATSDPSSRLGGVIGFIAFGNPEGQEPGDFIQLGINKRIKFWRTQLQSVRDALRPLKQSLKARPIWERVGNLFVRLESDVQLLDSLCKDDVTSPLRLAAMVLVQVYVAWRPKTTLDWLGEVGHQNGNPTFRMLVEQRGQRVVADRAAQALGEWAPFYRREIPAEDRISNALRKHDLVLIRGPGRREVFWKGKSYGKNWVHRSAQWPLLEHLVEALISGVGTDRCSVGSEINLPNARSRLSETLPSDLDRLIKTGGPGTYRLDLAEKDATILDIGQTEY